MSLETRALRDCMGCFATGVAVITAAGVGEGAPAGVTVNSFASVSLDPPLILWSLRRDSASVGVFSAAGGFLAHVLAEDQAALSRRFAGASADKWRGLPAEVGAFGAPTFAGAHALFACETFAVHEGGDHVIFLGRVVSIRMDPDKRPLIFYQGRYRELAA